ncbi:MAG: competence protein TfoX [Rhodobacterales bacterium]|nr:MAG: competence protein TfoX [Rhodobacterales bacterium]
MASSQDTVDRICAALAPAGDIRARKMFGEYGLYCDSVFIGTICDDRLFIKMTDPGAAFAEGLPQEPPYSGAKPSYHIPDARLSETAWLVDFLTATRTALAAKSKR